jgi:tRNA nucleotidyltransferase (CCA-adding enzyme)
VHGLGASPAAAFEQAALALTAVITDPASVRPDEMVTLSCEAPDTELLLAEWLNTLIYEMATRQLLFARFEVQMLAHQLRANAWGGRVDPRKHQPAVEVKGTTYTALAVRQTDDGRWLAQCVVDV